MTDKQLAAWQTEVQALLHDLITSANNYSGERHKMLQRIFDKGPPQKVKKK